MVRQESGKNASRVLGDTDEYNECDNCKEGWTRNMEGLQNSDAAEAKWHRQAHHNQFHNVETGV